MIEIQQNMPSELQRRRHFLRQAGAVSAASALGSSALSAFAADPTSVILPFANGEREMVTFPQKRSLILQTSRPPQLETPFSVFDESILTPNDAFFVRYHWSGIPTSIDPQTYRLRIGGNVNTPLELSLDDVKRMASPIQLVAVTQCSGNSRGFSTPRVAGGQSGNGAMGNARWTGVSLKAVLEKAGVKAGSMDLVYDLLNLGLLPDLAGHFAVQGPDDLLNTGDLLNVAQGDGVIALTIPAPTHFHRHVVLLLFV